jgi:hypothetical protein
MEASRYRVHCPHMVHCTGPVHMTVAVQWASVRIRSELPSEAYRYKYPTRAQRAMPWHGRVRVAMALLALAMRMRMPTDQLRTTLDNWLLLLSHRRCDSLDPTG